MEVEKMKAIINGCVWSNEKKYYDWDTEHLFVRFEVVSRTHYEIEANSLDEAHEWMLVNHPNEAVGCGINMENGDFLCDAVLDWYYCELHTDDVLKIASWQLDALKKKACA